MKKGEAMASRSSLLIKPYVSSADGRERQQNDIEIISAAIEQAGLTPLDGSATGHEVREDITNELIEYIHKADVVVVDANCYEDSGTFRVSPLLAYLIGLSHSLGNRTMLVSRTDHFPHSFLRNHILTYSSDGVIDFIKRLRGVVEDIFDDEELKSDNPIQQYRKTDDLKSQLAAAQAAAAAAQASVAQTASLKDELRKTGKQPRIVFHPVDRRE
jgi:hypothetical protein